MTDTAISKRQQEAVNAVLSRRFLHTATGRPCAVIGHCMIESTLQVGVLYVNLKDDDAGTIWCMPYTEFFDGRFGYVG